jgi:nucleotide-binding universal stress UspA family protein
MFQRILVPFDGSHASHRGLAEAIKLAAGQPVTLCLLHVVDDLATTPGMDGSMPMYIAAPLADDLLKALRDGGKRVLAKAESKARKAGVKTEALLVETTGHGVADVILRQARKARADLIVMGTHGRRGVARLVMGSDAEGVVRGTQLPVLLVRAPDRGPASVKRRGK